MVNTQKTISNFDYCSLIMWMRYAVVASSLADELLESSQASLSFPTHSDFQQNPNVPFG